MRKALRIVAFIVSFFRENSWHEVAKVLYSMLIGMEWPVSNNCQPLLVTTATVSGYLSLTSTFLPLQPFEPLIWPSQNPLQPARQRSTSPKLPAGPGPHLNPDLSDYLIYPLEEKKNNKKNKKKMPVRWSPPWNSSYGGVFMQIQLKHYDFSLRTSVPVSLAWARCAFASSLVIQGSACLDSLLICSCHPITTSKDVTLGRKTGWSEGNNKKKKTWKGVPFFIDPLSRPGLDLPFFFLHVFFLLPVASILDSTGHQYFFFFYISLFNLFWKENQQGFFGKKK